ncbi:MAG: dihydropteroate synthase [Actinomycetes bacterium]
MKRPLIMGVLNLTPDSFSDGGKFVDPVAAMAQAKLMVEQGANIIDIGGESTRPGADRVPLEVEQQRVMPVIEALVAADWFAESKVKISIDTMNSETAVAAVHAGASLVNDVSGGLADPKMQRAVAATKATYVLSHWRGFSKDMNTYAEYEDVAKDVAAELAEQVAVAVANGISRDRIMIDPGLGFSKDQAQNWQLVARLDELEKLGLPILVGASRKRFIAGVLDSEASAEVSNERRDVATAVLTALIMQRKLWGVRVHNVQTTVDAMAMVEALEVATPKSKEQS